MMIDMDLYLGSGMPLKNLYNLRRNTNYLSGIDKINQNINLIINTRVGSCLSNPRFGCRLYDVVFDLNTEAARDMADMYIREALTTWMDKIEILNIIIDDSPQSIDRLEIPITVEYRIKNTNTIASTAVNISI